jgi:hypothetical protein
MGGVDMGTLTDYLFVFTDGSTNADWQSASPGYIGDVAVGGIQADETTSGTLAYAGTSPRTPRPQARGSVRIQSCSAAGPMVSVLRT